MGGKGEEETSEAVQKCKRRENPLRESRSSSELLDSPITCFGRE